MTNVISAANDVYLSFSNGIDKFIDDFADQIEVVAKDYQVMVRKL